MPEAMQPAVAMIAASAAQHAPVRGDHQALGLRDVV